MVLTIGELIMYVTSYFGLYTSILFFLAFFENQSKLKSKESSYEPVITVAVPAYNEEKTLKKTVESILALDYPKEKLQVIIVDDGSKDDTLKIARTFERLGVKVITKQNTGKGDSLNVALTAANGELFTCLDADSFVDADCLKKMVSYFDDERVMAVTPSLKVYRPRGLLCRIQSIEYLLGVYLRKVFAYFDAIHVTPGPFTVYRKSFFDKYGGYDADNLTEDIEIALRIQSHGYRIENAIDACVWTTAPRKWGPLSAQRKRWYVGFMENVVTYKHLFSPKYKDLGLFILPGSFISVALAIILLVYIISLMVTRWYKGILNLIAINFDFKSLLHWNFDWFFVNVDPLVIIGSFALCMGIVVIWLAKHFSHERSQIKLSYVFFLFIYWMIFAYWWLVAGVTIARGKKIAWGRRSL